MFLEICIGDYLVHRKFIFTAFILENCKTLHKLPLRLNLDGLRCIITEKRLLYKL